MEKNIRQLEEHITDVMRKPSGAKFTKQQAQSVAVFIWSALVAGDDEAFMRFINAAGTSTILRAATNLVRDDITTYDTKIPRHLLMTTPSDELHEAYVDKRIEEDMTPPELNF